VVELLRRGSATRTDLRIGFAIDAAIVALAAFLRTWATAYLAGSVVHDWRLHTEQIVSGGPYRSVRNPLYLANLIMAVGYAGLASRLGWCIIIVGMLVFQYRLILREEALLLAEQGRSFEDYVSAVPRLFPAWRPRVPAGNLRPAWAQAFRAEVLFFGFAAGLLCFAITFNKTWTGAILLLSLLSYILSLRASRAAPP
jgi:hypothetical protein